MKMSHTLNCGEHARLNTILSKNVPLLFSLGNEKKNPNIAKKYIFCVKKEMSDVLNPKVNNTKQWTSFLHFQLIFVEEKKIHKW